MFIMMNEMITLVSLLSKSNVFQLVVSTRRVNCLRDKKEPILFDLMPSGGKINAGAYYETLKKEEV